MAVLYRQTEKEVFSKNGAKSAGEKRRLTPAYFLAPVLALMAFLVCCLQNPAPLVSNTVLAYDAWHYQETAQLIAAAGLEQLHRLPQGSAAAHGLNLALICPYLLLDGPLVPLLGSIPWLIIGRIPTTADVSAYLTVEALCHAASTTLVYLLGLRLFHSKKPAVIASLLWLFYPSAVIGAGTFMSEVPLATTLLLLLYCLCRSTEPRGTTSGPRAVWSLLAGLIAASLFVSKPAVAIVIFGLVALFGGALFTEAQSGKWRSFIAGYLAPVVLAFALVVGFWAAYTYKNSGHAYLAASRVPTFNVVKGSEPTADGWGTAPLTPTAMRYSAEFIPVTTALKGIWSETPQACFNLISRKLERLWGLPWNDYHYQFFGLSLSAQIWWHRMLLLVGVAGIALLPAYWTQRRDRSGLIVALACSGVIAAHCVYLPFETMSRYGFSSMPFVVLLATVALQLVSNRERLIRFAVFLLAGNVFLYASAPTVLALVAQLASSAIVAQWMFWGLQIAALLLVGFSLLRLTSTFMLVRRLASTASTGFVCLMVIVGGIEGTAHVLNDTEAREWSAVLKPGQAAVRTLTLPESPLAGDRSALLLIDGDQGIESATITINGHSLQDSAQSLYLFDRENASMLCRLQLHARLCRQPLGAMRQWRAVSVPVELLKFGGDENEIKVEVPSDAVISATVYGDYPSATNRVVVPSTKYISNGRCFHEIQSLDLRMTEYGTAFAPLGQSHWEHAGKSDTRDLAGAQGRQFGSYRMYLTFGAQSTRDHAQSLFAVQIPVSFAQKKSPVLISEKMKLPPSLTKEEQVRVDFECKPEMLAAGGISAGQIIFNGVAGEMFSLPGVPQSFHGKHKGRLSVTMPAAAFSGGLGSVQLALFGQWLGENKLESPVITISPADLPSLPKDAKLQ